MVSATRRALIAPPQRDEQSHHRLAAGSAQRSTDQQLRCDYWCVVHSTRESHDLRLDEVQSLQDSGRFKPDKPPLVTSLAGSRCAYLHAHRLNPLHRRGRVCHRNNFNDFVSQTNTGFFRHAQTYSGPTEHGIANAGQRDSKQRTEKQRQEKAGTELREIDR